jgi:hypothetical protein
VTTFDAGHGMIMETLFFAVILRRIHTQKYRDHDVCLLG